LCRLRSGGPELYFARTRVRERLNLLAKTLPAGTTLTLGPDATGVDHVFWYTVEGGGLSLRDLRSEPSSRRGRTSVPRPIIQLRDPLGR
jgi:Cu/Ag efflux pump CusA